MSKKMIMILIMIVPRHARIGANDTLKKSGNWCRTTQSDTGDMDTSEKRQVNMEPANRGRHTPTYTNVKYRWKCEPAHVHTGGMQSRIRLINRQGEGLKDNIHVPDLISQAQVVNAGQIPGVRILGRDNFRISVTEFNFLHFNFQFPQDVAVLVLDGIVISG